MSPCAITGESLSPARCLHAPRASQPSLTSLPPPGLSCCCLGFCLSHPRGLLSPRSPPLHLLQLPWVQEGPGGDAVPGCETSARGAPALRWPCLEPHRCVEMRREPRWEAAAEEPLRKCPPAPGWSGVPVSRSAHGGRWSATRLRTSPSLEGEAGSQRWRSLQQSPVSLATAGISPLHESWGLAGGEEPFFFLFFLGIRLCHPVHALKGPRCSQPQRLRSASAGRSPASPPG